MYYVVLVQYQVISTIYSQTVLRLSPDGVNMTTTYSPSLSRCPKMRHRQKSHYFQF